MPIGAVCSVGQCKNQECALHCRVEAAEIRSAPACCCYRQQLGSDDLDLSLVSRSPLTGSDRGRRGRGEGGGRRSRPYRISSLSEAAAYCYRPASLYESFSQARCCFCLAEQLPENSDTVFLTRFCSTVRLNYRYHFTSKTEMGLS